MGISKEATLSKAEGSDLDSLASTVSSLASANTGDQQGSTPPVTAATSSLGAVATVVVLGVTLLTAADAQTKISALETLCNAIMADNAALRSSLAGAGLLP